MTPTVLIPDLNKDNSVLKHIFQHGFSVCNIKEKSESAVNPSFSRWGGGRVEQESGVKKKKRYRNKLLGYCASLMAPLRNCVSSLKRKINPKNLLEQDPSADTCVVAAPGADHVQNAHMLELNL